MTTATTSAATSASRVKTASGARHGRRALEADLLIVGGGMVGATLAVAAGRSGLRVALVDRQDPAAMTDAAADGRVSAIAYAARRMFEALGLWRRMAGEAAPILDIRITDGRLDASGLHGRGDRTSPLFLHFGHQEVGDEPFGHMVENRVIRRALWSTLPELDTVRVLAPAWLAGLERREGGAVARLEDGTAIRAPLVVAAEGRASPLRRAAGIRTVGWRYPQTAIVTTVAHERPHQGVAQEHFLPSGPFAILPMTGNRSSLVWTERDRLAPAVLGLDDRAFDRELGRRFGGFLGTVRSQGRRWSYPLAMHIALRFSDLRLVLVGDAAHGIHPIAGQGLNLGLRDAAALAEIVTEAARLGLDIGSADLLARYERWRRLDTVAMAAMTDGLDRLFSTDAWPVRLVRDLGLGAVNRMPRLKRFFISQARGTAGDLPRLLEGRAL